MSKTRNFAEVIRAKLERDPQLKLDVELAAEISELEIAHAALVAENEKLRTACEAAQRFIRNGVEFGYIRMPEEGDSARDTLPMIDSALAAGRGTR